VDARFAGVFEDLEGLEGAAGWIIEKKWELDGVGFPVLRRNSLHGIKIIVDVFWKVNKFFAEITTNDGVGYE